MSKHRYILEPYKGMNTRYRCPNCQKRDKTFSRYIDKKTGEHINPNVGRCDRESNCGYHYTPRQHFKDNNILFDTQEPKVYKPRPVIPQPKPVSFIPDDIFKASLKAYETNNFVQFLINLFGDKVTSELISHYFIGTSKHWNGATIFWQIDLNGKIRTGKIILYSPITGKRSKEVYPAVSFVHNALKLSEFELKQCLFGEHLLSDKTKPVAIVESEKTAIIASVYLPKFIWLAVGGLQQLNDQKCSVLKGRNVVLFPDINGFNSWSEKALLLSHLGRFSVSGLLESKVSDKERKDGLDLADYLIKLDYKEFLENEETLKEEIVSDNKKTEAETRDEINPLEFYQEAYIDANGKLFIPTPLSKDKFTVYPNVESYNKRLCTPTFSQTKNFLAVEKKLVFIDLKTLKIEIN